MFSSLTVTSVLLGLAAGGVGLWGSRKIADWMGLKSGQKGARRILRGVFIALATIACAVVPALALGMGGVPVARELITGKGTFGERLRSLFATPEERVLQQEAKEHEADLQNRITKGEKALLEAMQSYGIDVSKPAEAEAFLAQRQRELIEEGIKYEGTSPSSENHRNGDRQMEYARLKELREDILGGMAARSMLDMHGESVAKKGQGNRSVKQDRKDPDRERTKKMLRRFATKTALKAARKAVLKF